ILSVIIFFIAGGILLIRVNVDEGIRVARAEEAVTSSIPDSACPPDGRRGS
ncbi:MAG: hypothetical protein JRJ50_03125, partial [Deltaproteobacteria bacterium]|nr:hypothetical protein [Deltaproteobacteria bacterium]